MKKKAILLAVTLTLANTSAMADVYVKVDANGNAIGGAIICDSATCGAGSLYSQLTLNEGERYVLQGVGVDYGIGNNNPNTTVQHDDRSNEWVVTREQRTGVEPVVERFNVITPTPTPEMQTPVITETQTVLTETTTALSDTSTVTNLESITATVTESVTVQDVLKKINALLAIIFQLLAKLGA